VSSSVALKVPDPAFVVLKPLLHCLEGRGDLALEATCHECDAPERCYASTAYAKKREGFGNAHGELVCTAAA
jgi:hypothetical protein